MNFRFTLCAQTLFWKKRTIQSKNAEFQIMEFACKKPFNVFNSIALAVYKVELEEISSFIRSKTTFDWCSRQLKFNSQFRNVVGKFFEKLGNFPWQVYILHFYLLFFSVGMHPLRAGKIHVNTISENAFGKLMEQ